MSNTNITITAPNGDVIKVGVKEAMYQKNFKSSSQ